MRLELITRLGCHLCDDALAALGELGHEPAVLDVDSDEELRRQFDFRVPVVRLDGRVVAEGRISKEQLARVLVKE